MLQSLTRAEVTKQPAAKQSGMGFGLATLQPKIAPPLAPSKIAAPIQSNNRPFAKQAEPKAEPKQLEGQPGLKTADAKPPSATTANNPTSKPTALGTSPTTPPVKANPDSARGLAAQIASAKAAQKKAKPAGKTAVAKVASGVAGVEAKPMPVEGKAPVPALPDLSKAAPTATSAKALGLPPMITPPNQAARITSNFVQAPLSSKIRQMTGLGTQLSQGEQSDRLVTAQTTPPLSLAINPAPPMPPPLANSTLPKPKPPGPEPKGPLPTGVGDVEGQAVDTGFHYDTETNPAQIDQEQLAQQKVAQTGAGQGQAELAAVPGSELIKPKSLNQSHPIVLAPAQPTGEYQATSDMQAYLDRPLPDPVRSGADQAYHDYLAPQTAGPNDQVSQAFADRDAQVVQAQTQALATSAKLNKQGNDDQESEMNRAKAEIDGHKADALAEGEAKVASFHQDSEQARQEKLGQVKSGVANSEAQSQIELVKARQAALKKQQEAQAQEAEKRAAERRKPWWKRAWDAITSFVTDIWNAFKSAVNGIIDAAKSVISAVMKACSLLVTALIKAYAAYLKVLVGALLVFFPALKAKVMALIDQAVAVLTDVCNKIIDAVASAILAAVDQVQAAVNKAFAVAEALAEGGLAMLTAILTGNWSELLMIAFKTACKVAGVPPEPILMLLKSVKDNFMEVITHPVAFFSNLGRAVKDGFLNFMKNVGQHVLKGLMGWLMGGLAGAGIELPAKWDLPGIFGLLRQVFGFTLAYVEQVARSVLGDQALDIIFKVVDYFKILINEGPMGLWNLVKEKLADLKEKFVGMIIDFVVGQVVQKAITKLITMIIPGGGIVQAVLGIYNMVQLFFQKLNQIITVVAKWLQSMGQIAKGQVTAAANHIEEVMVDSLPLVFGFLASFIGLGDVPSKLGVLIEKLRTPVRLVLTKAIQGTVRVFKKGWAKLKAGATSLKDKAKAKLSGWWNQRRHFKTKKGDAHELDFVGAPPKLKVASDEPLPMRSRVEKWQGWAAKADARAQEKSSDTKSRLARALSLTQKLEAVANKDEETQAKAPAGDAKTPKPAPLPPTPSELNELIRRRTPLGRGNAKGLGRRGEGFEGLYQSGDDAIGVYEKYSKHSKII